MPLSKASSIYLTIKNDYPDYGDIFLDRNIEEVKSDLSFAKISLKVEADKYTYQKGEAINITFSYENKGTDTVQIKLEAIDSLPLAFMDLHRINDYSGVTYDFEQISGYDSYKTQNLVLLLNETKKAICDITFGVLSSRGYCGSYRFGKYFLPKGKYKIIAYGPFTINEYCITSEAVFFEVE